MLRRRTEACLRALWFSAGPLARTAGALLAPLSWLTRRHAQRARAQIEALAAPRPPVVVVGNLVAGGAGKTPLVIALTLALQARGLRVGVLCSGYRARRTDARLVGARDDPSEHGDEPVLLARGVSPSPVAAGRDRAAALALLVRQAPRLDVVLSDDGLQHARLPRTLELVVFDSRGLGNGRLLPAGPLRAPLEHARRADAIVLNGAAPPPFEATRSFRVRIEPLRVVPVGHDGPESDPRAFSESIRDRTVAAVAGIANPTRFFDTLRALGIAARPIPLDDHATIEASDLARIPADLVLMTAKDAVKCRNIADERCFALEIAAIPDPGLIDWLHEALSGQSTP